MHTGHIDLVLRALRDVIRENKPFDMGDWCEDEHHAYDCKTAACALGWTARTREGQAAGLYFDSRGELKTRQGVPLNVWCGMTPIDFDAIFHNYRLDAPSVLTKLQDAVIEFMRERGGEHVVDDTEGRDSIS